jgi:saccharopine dehydrogenase (NADP+, L-glutamate forming)
MKAAVPYFIYPGYAFVSYPNRDSTGYKERYNIPEAETVIRGTLRYQGFPEFVRVLVDIGLLSKNRGLFILWFENSVEDAFAKVLGSNSSKEEYLPTGRG